MSIRAGVALAIAAVGGVADAHPVHEIVQNAYLTLAPGTVTLQLDLTAGPQVAGVVIALLDTDRDRRVSRTEGDAFAARVLRASAGSVDGRALAWRATSVAIPAYAALRGAHGTIRITATAVRVDRPGFATLTYRNGFSPAESRCDANIFLRPADGWRYLVRSQARSNDGRRLAVRYAAARSR